MAQSRLTGTEEILEDRGVALSGLSGQWTEASGEKVVAGWLRLNAGRAVELVNEWIHTGIQPPEQVVQLHHSFPPPLATSPRSRPPERD